MYQSYIIETIIAIARSKIEYFNFFKKILLNAFNYTPSLKRVEFFFVFPFFSFLFLISLRNRLQADTQYRYF